MDGILFSRICCIYTCFVVGQSCSRRVTDFSRTLHLVHDIPRLRSALCVESVVRLDEKICCGGALRLFNSIFMVCVFSDLLVRCLYVFIFAD